MGVTTWKPLCSKRVWNAASAAALRSERGELYHLRATRQISNETLQKLLHDLDLLEALLIEDQ
ncbi:hypothetical protein KPZU09_47780 [Klebsiella pneumoniae]|uniref:Uncharacterized protein n=1 Tax=Klebsiella pneumoniae TaxID=573 RepID=A0A919HWF9_KLEPN|nr:hypothetical protein KPZU09_47780 [Klebsiella pneumoniae]